MGCGASTSADRGGGGEGGRDVAHPPPILQPQPEPQSAAAPEAEAEPQQTVTEVLPEPEPPAAAAELQEGAELTLAFSGVRDLWFSAAELGRGRALVALQDTATAHRSTLAQIFAQFAPATATGSSGAAMSKAQWISCAQAMQVDLDADALADHFDEVLGYLEDDDEDSQDLGGDDRVASLGQFASMLCRVANDLTLQVSHRQPTTRAAVRPLIAHEWGRGTPW
eukprot:COSAG01_NODE_16142_length_1266_cov_1.766067_1_plen_223_part_10